MNDNTNHLLEITFSLTKTIRYHGYENATVCQLQQLREMIGNDIYEYLEVALPKALEHVDLKKRRP